MEKFSKQNFENIQAIVRKKTGVSLESGRKIRLGESRRFALLACCLLCFITLSAFAYVKFSDLNGDTAGFAAAYQGNGRFEIVVVNYSNVELKLQDNVKIMQWSTGREVAGDNGKIRFSGLTVAPHSQGVVSLDISEGYDVVWLEKNLPADDWYYFVLTNNNFVFGQDWQCSFDFEVEPAESAAARLAEVREQNAEEPAAEQTGDLRCADWLWPTVSRTVSGVYGGQRDHINIAGASGDDVYAVADGVVTETGFESYCGNYLVLDLGDGTAVKYGHLAEVNAAQGDEVKRGQVIGTLGQTGMATGPNLLLAVSLNGEAVNPLLEEAGE